MDSSIFELGHVHSLLTGVKPMIINKMASSVSPDEMAQYEPSHLNLHCLHRYLYQSTRLNGLLR